MEYILLLIIAIFPIIFLGLYINGKDREKEPKGLLAGLFISGIFSCFLVLIISIFMELVFPIFGGDSKTYNFIELFIYVFIGISLVEEGCKWFFTTIIGYRNKNFDDAYDIIVYSTFVSLGFAAIENVLYSFEYGLSTSIFRAFTSVPGHVCFGITMGYYLLLAKIAKKNNNKKLHNKNLAFSLLIPVLYHGIYDYLIFSGNTLFILVLLVLAVLFFSFSFRRLNTIASITEKVKYEYNYCPKCGNEINTLYCSNCGYKNK